MAVGFQVRAALAVSKVRAQRGRRPPGAGELSGATPIRRLADSPTLNRASSESNASVCSRPPVEPSRLARSDQVSRVPNRLTGNLARAQPRW